MKTKCQSQGRGQVGSHAVYRHLEALGDGNVRVWKRACAIPDSATIDSAVLSICQRAEEYWGGYTLGPVLVEHFYFGTDTALGFGSVALSRVAGVLESAFSAGYKNITVTVEVQNDMDQNRPRAQFRFFHSTPTDNAGDNTTDDWVMGDSPVNQPKLVVTYH